MSDKVTSVCTLEVSMDEIINHLRKKGYPIPEDKRDATAFEVCLVPGETENYYARTKDHGKLLFSWREEHKVTLAQ